LFLLYVNDVVDCLRPNTNLKAYADDKTLYAMITACPVSEEACSALQTSVHQVEQWGRKWRIKFEPSKSQAIKFALHRQSWDVPAISFGNVSVNEHKEIKLLGVVFDSRLNFTSHVRSVAIKARQRLGLLRKAARLLDSKGMTAVYKGFIRPVMEYAPLVWMGTAPGNLARLDRVQESASALIGPAAPLQSLSHRRAIAALCYIYTLQDMSGPAQLRSILPPRLEPPVRPRTRQQHRVVSGHAYQLASTLPARCPDMLRRAFPHCVVPLWNSLPAGLFCKGMHKGGLHGFKSAVNKHLS